MAYTTIDDPSAHFHIQLHTGTGSTQTVTNDANAGDFKPDLIWVKNRDDTDSHMLSDSNRGSTKALTSQDDIAEFTPTNGDLAFLTDGYSFGSNNNYNRSSDKFVAWQWKANGGTATATGSESGDNPAYSAQANQTAGFSIITYTGTGAEGDVTHGLGGKPDWIITKNRDEGSDSNWVVWHKDMVDADADNGAYAYLNTNGEDQATSVFYEGDAISNTVVAFKGGNQNTNKDTIKYVMYCFRSIQGYSKFGAYKGNGNADGTFVYTGFQPAWLMVKRVDSTGEWLIYDNKRDLFNLRDTRLEAQDNFADSTGTTKVFDFLSNGFKCKGSDTDINADGGRYIYMAFAEHPFVSSRGVPTTAR